MDDADGPTLDQIVQAFVLDAPSRGSRRVRIVVQGDELQACFFNGADFQVGVVVPANWIDRVERRLKLMANALLTDPRVPQRGRFRRAATVGGRFCELDVEVSTNPDPATRCIELTIMSVRWGAATTDPCPRLLGEDVVLFRKGPPNEGMKLTSPERMGARGLSPVIGGHQGGDDGHWSEPHLADDGAGGSWRRCGICYVGRCGAGRRRRQRTGVAAAEQGRSRNAGSEGR